MKLTESLLFLIAENKIHAVVKIDEETNEKLLDSKYSVLLVNGFPYHVHNVDFNDGYLYASVALFPAPALIINSKLS